MKRILKKILVFLPVIYLVFIPVYMTRMISTERCHGVSVDIADSARYHFVTKRHLAGLVNTGHGKILGREVKNVPLTEIEAKVQEIRDLRVAEVFISADGIIHIYADQRNPVIRVIPDGGGDFFLDEEGVLVRKRNLYNPRLHIAGGNITISKAMLDGVSVLDTSIKKSVLKDIYHLVKYIDRDDFWSAQIDQIYVDNNNEIDLIPRAGNQLIHIGTADDIEKKLKNLEAFYDEVLPEVGWNKYSVINLEYRDQIVCKRRDNQN